MKKLILAASLVAGLSTISLSQPTSTVQPVQKHQHEKLSPEERAKKDAGRAEKDLGLNSTQKSQWEAASLKMMAANKPYRDKMSGSTTPEERMELKKQMRVNAKVFDDEVDGFLTPDQKAKWAELRVKHKDGHHEKMQRH